MAVVGDQFDDCESNGDAAAPGAGTDSGSWRAANVNGAEDTSEPEICGCTLSVRQSEDILSVWNRRGSDSKVNQKIKCVVFFPCHYRSLNVLLGILYVVFSTYHRTL